MQKEHIVALLETQQLGQVGQRGVIVELFEYHIRNIKDMTARRKYKYWTSEEMQGKDVWGRHINTSGRRISNKSDSAKRIIFQV